MKMENMETAEQMQESDLPDEMMSLMTQDELRAKIKKMEMEVKALEAMPDADQKKIVKLMADIAIARGKLLRQPKGEAPHIPGIEYR